MLRRILRIVLSWFGFVIDQAEDPEMILRQLQRDMQDHLPGMRNAVAQTMAGEHICAQHIIDAKHTIANYDGKIKAAIKMGRDDIAQTFIAQMQEQQFSLERLETQHEQLQKATDASHKALDNYELQVRRKKGEIEVLISQSRNAKLQSQLAETMQSFQIGDTAGTLNDMRDKIETRSAQAQARLELASNSTDSAIENIDQEVAHAQVTDALAAYKQQLGLVPSSVQSGDGDDTTVQVKKTLSSA